MNHTEQVEKQVEISQQIQKLNIFVAETMFHSLPICFQMFPARETLFSRLGMLKHCFKTIVQT